MEEVIGREAEMIDEKLTKDLNEFEIELQHLINRYSLENMSNTPDFILAKYLVQCLFNFNITSNDRETWYGKKLSIEGK